MQQVGDLRAQAQNSVSTVSDKLAQIESLIAAPTSSQEAAELELAVQVDEGVEANLAGIQQEVTCSQGEVGRTQAGIQTLIDSAKNDGSSSLFRSSQERDRQLFDPRDYKIEVLPN